MKLNPTTSLNDAIKRIAEGNTGAASVLALIVKELPDRAMTIFHSIDQQGIYGNDLWVAFSTLCRQDMRAMLVGIGDGSLQVALKATRNS
jgi:hypothetical protein